MSTTRIRLTATAPVRWLLVALGLFVSGWFAWSCLQAILAPAQPWWMRLLAVAFAAVFVGPWIGLLLGTRTRLRRMELDDRGLRLLRGDGAPFTDLRWDELAGVGVMVDEAAARHELRGKHILYRLIMHRVPPWLELAPAGADVVSAHPELGAPVPAGDGRPARWLVRLNSGWARRPAVASEMARRQPALWWGERHGSTPRRLRSTAPHPIPTITSPPAPAGPEHAVDLPRGPRIRSASTALFAAVLVTVLALTLDLPGWSIAALMVPTSLTLLVALVALIRLRHPIRLVADEESLRLVRGTRVPDWRIPWSDAAAIRMERRGGRATLYVRPTGPDAVDAHPLLDRFRTAGRPVEWRLPLGHVESRGLAVRELVLRHRADLWVDGSA